MSICHAKDASTQSERKVLRVPMIKLRLHMLRMVNAKLWLLLIVQIIPGDNTRSMNPDFGMTEKDAQLLSASNHVSTMKVH